MKIQLVVESVVFILCKKVVRLLEDLVIKRLIF